MANKPDLIDPLAFDLEKLEHGPEFIRSVNPQRFEMEHLDGILRYEREKCLIVGVKRVRADEWWTRGHIPGRPLLPAVLMLEAAAQLGSVYLALTVPGERSFWGFGGIDEARFRAVVQPGDALVLAVLALDVRKRYCKFDFQGFVGARRVVEGSILGMNMGAAGSREA
jgi:3-hydroxyacyl-[acyl-carrier-protein] dehydratase